MESGKEHLGEMYRKMVLIRTFEYTVKELLEKGIITGDLHLYVGQEAVGVGICAHLSKNDYITTTHRGHGHCIAKGTDINRLMAEFFAKRTGLCKGKGGSMHLADFSVGMAGATPIVGAGIPIAVGAALSSYMRKSDQVTVAFFGDGATNQGTFHESLNLASIWKLPIVFVCENNQYAESTPIRKVTSVEIAERARAYGIPGVKVDGMDVLDVYRAAGEAIARARGGKGPTLMQCDTFRYEGHELGDPWELYITKEEFDSWKKRDPIVCFKRTLLDKGIFSERELSRIEEEMKRIIDEAVKFAERSPPPSPEEALEDVFVSPLGA